VSSTFCKWHCLSFQFGMYVCTYTCCLSLQLLFKLFYVYTMLAQMLEHYTDCDFRIFFPKKILNCNLSAASHRDKVIMSVTNYQPQKIYRMNTMYQTDNCSTGNSFNSVITTVNIHYVYLRTMPIYFLHALFVMHLHVYY